ncbi:MAG: glutamate-1-semialdehyde 2,1-aminomutase [Candidatus Dadabacteria bacterium]|nr:glutamate-1-semialdehyde 2,1-aminomutase [Candidatus Dadabacteria bacterium]NIS07258.1 glutamate-1-semialdehyde 2,1-aminomutase [Candidatus Dadabacteria bacterium]NIV40965.1 glutamate-1-semialdehyde 2,1-aminomutase [Candidatus Dadabacteria bacterium]NIY21196.1 glutamate-1-semialdehyde 2,1-aminomutase [Candidatus Dadabacteria bacterium]
MSTTRSHNYFKKAKKLMPGGVNSPVRSFSAVGGAPVFISKAKGPYLYDEDGNRYIDFVASWGPLILGHSHPNVVKALKEASVLGTSYGAPCKAEIELAGIVTGSFKSIDLVRMTNSGTEATMSTVRLARGYTGRDYIVKFEGCYHGHADYLLVKAGSGATTFGHPSSPGVPKSFTSKTLLAKYNDIDSVKKLFNKYGDKIAAIILEPVAGNMGVVTPGKGFLKGLRSITRKHKSLLIFDEVITGFRLGKGGAQQLFGVYPDITCLGKIIGGGLPVGAYGGKKAIMKHIAPEGPVYQAGTLSGNPLAMAAGIATLKELAGASVYNKLEKTTVNFVAEIREIIKKQGINATINQIGSMFTIFFNSGKVADYETALSSDTKIFSRFFKNLLSAGIMFPPSQFESVFISTAHTDKELNFALNSIHKALKSL